MATPLTRALLWEFAIDTLVMGTDIGVGMQVDAVEAKDSPLAKQRKSNPATKAFARTYAMLQNAQRREKLSIGAIIREFFNRCLYKGLVYTAHMREHLVGKKYPLDLVLLVHRCT